jgi:hypothetical protein
MTSVRNHHDTREPRAAHAVGAQRRILHGDAPSAHHAGRDGRLGVPHEDICRGQRRARSSRNNRRRTHVIRAPHRTPTRRGVNDPLGQRPGPHRPRGAGVVHAPLSVHHPGAPSGGRHKAPSGFDEVSAHNVLLRRGLAAAPLGDARPGSGSGHASRLKGRGTSSLAALVPLLDDSSEGNQGRRRSRGRPLGRDSRAAGGLNVEAAMGRRRGGGDAPLRRRRPGGRGASTVARGR